MHSNTILAVSFSLLASTSAQVTEVWYGGGPVNEGNVYASVIKAESSTTTYALQCLPTPGGEGCDILGRPTFTARPNGVHLTVSPEQMLEDPTEASTIVDCTMTVTSIVTCVASPTNWPTVSGESRTFAAVTWVYTNDTSDLFVKATFTDKLPDLPTNSLANTASTSSTSNSQSTITTMTTASSATNAATVTNTSSSKAGAPAATGFVNLGLAGMAAAAAVFIL